jgi:hypothetical protein
MFAAEPPRFSAVDSSVATPRQYGTRSLPAKEMLRGPNDDGMRHCVVSGIHPAKPRKDPRYARRQIENEIDQDSRERRLVVAVLDGPFDRILILSPICPRDLR